MIKDLKTLIIMLKSYQNIENNIKHSLVGSNLNVNEFAALEALDTKGPLSTQELIDTVLIPNSSMTYVLEILTKKGLITKDKKANDKRVQIITLSKKGKDVFEEIYQEHFKHMRSIFNVLNEEEELQLQNLLKKLGKEAMEVLA